MGFEGHWWDADLFVGGYRLSGDTREIRLSAGAEMLDATCFGMRTKCNVAGLASIDLTAAGLVPAAALADLKEAALFTGLGRSDIPVSVFPQNGSREGDRAYFFQSARAQLELQGRHGQLYGFSLAAHGGEGGAPLVRGCVLEPGRIRRTASGHGAGTARIGPVPEGRCLYAVLHAFSIEGADPQLEVRIESAPDADFAAPTTCVAFLPVGSEVAGVIAARLAGPVADNWFRSAWDISDAGAGYQFAVAAGVA